MTTADNYLVIANEVYAVGALQDTRLQKGTEIPGAHGSRYVVYETLTDPDTGTQAMAVVPVVDGQPDLSTVILSYAGTNPDERADLLADLQSVIGGQSGPGTQVHAAQDFAGHVRDRLAAEGHADASMEAVGHSLGGYLALWVAAENGWSATTFNAPDPWEALSPEAQGWVKKQVALGRHPFTNYVNEYDLVGNIFGNRTGAAVYVGDAIEKETLEYHNLSSFKPNPDGSIKGVVAEGRSMEEILRNVSGGLRPGLGMTLAPALEYLASSLQKPEFAASVGKAFSGLVVVVDTVGALALAASIAGTETHLATIKRINTGLVSEMHAALMIAKQAAFVYPFITEADIENCVNTHLLHVDQNIDVAAVDAVDRLVDDHIFTVRKIYDGVSKTVENAVAQDARWAAVYNGR